MPEGMITESEAPAAESAAPVGASSAPPPESSPPTPQPAEAPAPEAFSPSEPTVSEPEPAPFDWDSWDGETDGLPEDLREVGGHFHSHYSTRLANMKSDLDQMNAWYEALGTEDPQIAEFQTKLAEGEARYQELTDRIAAQEADWEKMLTQDARDYADWFWKENADIKKDPKLTNRLVALTEHGFDAEDAAKLCRLADDVVEQAAQAMQQGAPSGVAVKMAELYAAKQVPAQAATPNSSALLVDDGSTRQRASDTQPSMSEMQTPQQRRLYAAQSALKKHGL